MSLLPIFVIVLEKPLFSFLFFNFHHGNIFTKCQSGFIPCDFCISQRLSIIHKILSSLDYKSPTDVRAIFLDIWNTFDNVWHQGLLLKIKSYGIDGNLFRLLELP